MGVTLAWRDLLVGTGGAVLVLGLALAVRWGGGEGGPPELVTAEDPLVIEAPSLRVVAGRDTVVIFGPTAFVFVGTGSADGEPPRGFPEVAEAFSAALLQAQDGLAGMGVKVVAVDAPPVPLGIPSEVDAAAGPRIMPVGTGVLLADGRGRIRRLDRLAEGATLVCAAAGTFRLRPPPSFGAACPP